MADIQSRMREIVEATRWQTSAPGADAVWRRGHRRRRTKVAGGVVLLTVGLVATGTVGQALLRNPTRPTVGGTVAVPSSTPSRSLSCPKGPVACGESQGIRWQVRLLERGILTPGTPPGRSDPGRIVRFSVGYGDATGRPTGAAEAITIPVRALRARIWVAFIPATAWLVGLDGFDAQGNPLDQAGASSACSTPPRLPLLTCRRAGPAPTSHG